MHNQWIKACFFLIFSFTQAYWALGQQYWDKVKALESTLGISEGTMTFTAGEFELVLLRSSQTVAALRPKTNLEFDFTPGERLDVRDKDGMYHLGDLNLRLRAVGNTEWKSFSTATSRAAIRPLDVASPTLAGADLSNTLPPDIPLKISRFYELSDGQLVMRFSLTNQSVESIEIGALGIPMVFNNILEGKSLDQAHEDHVFYDPYIGLEAGYLEVKGLKGTGQVLLALPQDNMPFEAYRPLLDDPTPRSIVFEGFYEWMRCSRAYAENEWRDAIPWNKATSIILEPGETQDFALKLVLAESVRDIEETLSKNNHPVAIGVPGYVVPMDIHAQLFVDYQEEIQSIHVSPQGALTVKDVGFSPDGKRHFQIRGVKWGRAVITIRYKDDKRQTIHYKIIKPESEVVDDLGDFLTTVQWFENQEDPFGRDQSVITYDYEAKKQVVEDPRAWICGLGDEGGASWLSAIMKQLVQPDPDQIVKLQRFIDETLWGGLQYSEGSLKYGVKKSLFYYQPDALPEDTYSDSINYHTWAAWNKEHAALTERSYNYPHVAAAYWVMYRLSRYRVGLVDNHQWDWYLTQAYETSIAMVEQAPYYAQFGQMEGSVFLLILKDLKNEGLMKLAGELEARMKVRTSHWQSLKYPFGSEMPWDSTGQEEVYMWSRYFGFDDKAIVTLHAILAYMPTMPHWAYNGNARRYWDFLYGGKAGKTSRVERQIHHYGSSLNAIPVLSEYRRNAEDLYLLRVGYGGLLGGIANITRDGFGPAAFHSFPGTLKIDGISGDYGSGFYGYAVNSSAYLTYSHSLGWLGFGGNISLQGDVVALEVLTASKSRVYVAPLRLWLTLDAGTFEKLQYHIKNKKITITLGRATDTTPNAYLRVETDAQWEGSFNDEKLRGAYVIPLKKRNNTFELRGF